MLIIVRINFKKKLDQFYNELELSDIRLINSIQSIKIERINRLATTNKQLSELVRIKFSIDSSYLTNDTLFKYFYIRKKVTHKYPSIQYLDCLISKCELDIQNQIDVQKIAKKNKILKTRFNDDYDLWFKNLQNKIIPKDTISLSCSKFFKNYTLDKYNESNWIEFEKLLISYQNEKRKTLLHNREVVNKLNNLVNSTRTKLNSHGYTLFDEQINLLKSELIKSDTVKCSYNSVLFGNITYNLPTKNLQMKIYSDIEAQVLIEQYKSNSLHTGATPYSKCYGSYNSCDSWNCSEIKIENSGLDVVVFIKNRSNAVVRHAYIKSEDEYTFNLPDGSYIVYFYSGSGWNPYKPLNSSNCNLTGGFISNEATSRGDYENLMSQQLTYELRLQESGNFSPRSANLEDALN
jgi:hypothetical protein